MKPLDAALVPAGICPAQVTTWRGAQAREQADWLADEVPVALVFNGISHAVMLASPSDLEDFALGFGLTEGLLASASELHGVEVHAVPDGIELHLDVASACAWRLKEHRRTLAGRTGCGLCGTDSLGQVRRALPSVAAGRLTPQALARAQRELRLSQAVQQLTGATHAAAWCAADGRVQLVREDIGRHNALDKLVGAMVRSAVSAAEGFICVTSRASFEMVQKSAMAGVGTLAAVSAPTALAVETARRCGLALAGFVRGDELVAYTFPSGSGWLLFLVQTSRSTMDIDNLVRMANRIGEFFQAMPDREEACREIAQHLRKFWEPRMRRELLEHLDETDGAGLLAIVRDAVREHRQALA